METAEVTKVAKKKKGSIEEVVQSKPLSEEDREALGIEEEDSPLLKLDDAEDVATRTSEEAPPAWAIIPHDFKMPDGRLITYVRFLPDMTDTPKKGERQAILWNLSAADEKIAIKRTRGEALYTLDELARQMVRAVDGIRTDWTGKRGPGSIDPWWDEIGGKCRQQLKNVYAKAHTFSTEEAMSFFTDCVAVRTYQGG